MIRQLFTVSTMIMALGMTPTQAQGGGKKLVSRKLISPRTDNALVPLLTLQVSQ